MYQAVKNYNVAVIYDHFLLYSDRKKTIDINMNKCHRQDREFKKRILLILYKFIKSYLYSMTEDQFSDIFRKHKILFHDLLTQQS